MRKWFRHTYRVFSLKAKGAERIEWLGQTFNIMGHISMVFDALLTGVTYYLINLPGSSPITTAYFTLLLNLPNIQQLAIAGIGWSLKGWFVTGLTYGVANYYNAKLIKGAKRGRKYTK